MEVTIKELLLIIIACLGILIICGIVCTVTIIQIEWFNRDYVTRCKNYLYDKNIKL